MTINLTRMGVVWTGLIWLNRPGVAAVPIASKKIWLKIRISGRLLLTLY
jgi:hypothetical protein